MKKNVLKGSAREEKPRRLTLRRETLQVLSMPLLKNAEGGNALPTTSYTVQGES